ncbi:methyltransferase TYW3-domain-containing protein [Sporodiniella umbellata]|nr:methyltransferase TYW3-domain-containing protein [Sporodiniella umbellata]
MLVEHVDPERRDKSPKGFIDAPILDLMHVINQHPDYYTTSSCSGRVAMYCPALEDDKATTKGGNWLYVSHDPIEVPEDSETWILSLLFGNRPVEFTRSPTDCLNKQWIYFKFEPLILHIEASSQQSGMHLLNIASQVGYQNSGITPSRRHMLAIRSTLKIDTPVAYVENDTVYCIVDAPYLVMLLRLSNEKFEQNISRMKVFEDSMKLELEANQAKPVWESKQERSERMRREGLARRQEQTKKDKSEAIDMIDVFEG